jgi:endo-1,4-beta-mannosidase
LPSARHDQAERWQSSRLLLPIVVVLLVAIIATSYALAQTRKPPAPPVSSEYPLPPITLSEIRGVNYVRTTVDDPDICPDLHYGQDQDCPWDLAAIEADLDRLSAQGVNTLRIFLNYYAFGGARLSNPNYTMDQAMEHLDTFVDAANRRGMYVMPILLSKYPQDHGFEPDYYEIALDVHVRPVVSHFAGHEGIIAWDLFNEIDIGSPIDQRCWDWSNEDFPLCIHLARERVLFLKAMGDEVRRLDPDTPITASMAFAKNFTQPPGTAYQVADLVDFFSFHYYDNEPYDSGRYEEHWYYGEGFPADLERALIELDALGTDKPIVLTEIGFLSGPDTTRTHAMRRRDLATAFELVYHEYDSGFMLWPFQIEPEELVGDLFST